MSTTTISPLAATLKAFFERDDLFELFTGGAIGFFRNILIPLAIALLITGGIVHVLKSVFLYFFPAPDPVRYKEAKDWYRQGFVRDALREWKLLDGYVPAYLSLACHELHVLQHPDKALQILDEAKKLVQSSPSNDFIDLKKSLDGMRLDAQAMLKGNQVMAKLNSVVAKEDYLGICT